MSPRPRIPSARFVSDRNSADRRYNKPKTAATAASKRTRSQRTARALGLAGRATYGSCSGPFIRLCYTAGSPVVHRSKWSSGLLGPGTKGYLRDLIEGVAGQLYGGGVHHLPIHAHRARALSVRLIVGRDDLPGPLQLSFGGREDFVDHFDLGRVDAPLAVEAQGTGDQAAPAQPFFVAIICNGTVEDAQPGSAGRDDDALHGVVEAVAGVGFVPLIHYTDAV